jgi:hypothetical protein
MVWKSPWPHQALVADWTHIVGVTTTTPGASGSDRDSFGADHDPVAILLGPADSRQPHLGRR